MTFRQMKKQEAENRMAAIRRARRSPAAAAAEQKRASLVGVSQMAHYQFQTGRPRNGQTMALTRNGGRSSPDFPGQIARAKLKCGWKKMNWNESAL
jgi:hypothetical protein